MDRDPQGVLPADSPMLQALCIENLALVERIELNLGRGLNVLSGETGAGKSVLVDALSMVLGSRTSAEVIRSGAEQAVVEALFDLPQDSPVRARLLEQGVEIEDGELVVRRVISRAGKGRATLNGQLVTVSMLAGLLRGVVDVTGQHEHVSLLDPDGHLDIVDEYGGLLPLRRRVSEAHAEVQGYRAALDALVMDEAEKARREDYLRFSLEEIEQVDPRPGELEALELERKRLRSITELAEGVRRAEGSLYSEDGAVIEVVGRVQQELVRLSRLDERLAPLAASSASVLAELEELSRGLVRYQGGLSADPERLERLEDRLEALKKLARKHGGSLEAVLSAREALAEELDGLEHEEARRADLLAALEVAERERGRLAVELSAGRQRVVSALERAISEELAELCMEKTRLAVALQPLPEVGPRGAEGAEILISPNVGEPLRPLRKIASGGELSRVLLAVKNALSTHSLVGTFVFDEIDTGIGGAVADVLGRKLREVARRHQVIVVTHLPQVAAHGDQHFRVLKTEDKGRTTTLVRALDDGARVEELARMLGGQTITDRTRSLAAEMLGQGGGAARGRRVKERRS